MLDREEYVEQAYFFRTLHERMGQAGSTQELLGAVREELLATTKLPLAIDFMAGELRHTGALASAMAKLPHYFTPFQTYVVTEAENEQGRFDFRVALDILCREAQYRADGASPQGLFLYQFESLCRNRLSYDRGLEAVAADPIFNADWKAWILTVRRQVGIVDIADLLYVRSQYYLLLQARRGHRADSTDADPNAADPNAAAAAETAARDATTAQSSGGASALPKPVLFGEKEGRIALANRRKDPLYLFSALQRHLGYPAVPRPKPADESPHLLASLARQLNRMEARLKLLEEEQRGGIDLSKFYGPKSDEPPARI